MIKNLLAALFLFAFAPFGIAQISVNVATPTPYATVAAPLRVRATATSSRPITGWHVYVDGRDAYSGPAAGTIDTSIATTTGTHQVVVRAWDSSGAYDSRAMQVIVSSSTGVKTGETPAPATSKGLPTPPSTAKVFNNIEEMTSGWGTCNTPACAGGSGAGTYWQAFNQTSPSLDGRSMQLYQTGSWSNALWYKKLGKNNSVTNFLWDFWVQLDKASLTAAQTLEYDAFQFVGGYNYMIGTQCNYAARVWDTWNEYTGKWLHTTIPCQKFTPGTWHHIQWYMTTNHTNHTYTYKTLVVDGVVYNLNQTQPAKYLGWADNLGAQWQLDVNASGTGYHEWVDKAKLTVW